MADSFDYVIVGAGTAGALLAARLAQTPGTTVCVLEAGESDSGPFVTIPVGLLKLASNPAKTWIYMTQPGADIADRPQPVVQGRIVGGSGTINGLVHTRGQAADYDGWAALGNKGWAYKDVIGYFRKTETWSGAPSAYRGRRGELPVEPLRWQNDLVDRFLDAAGGLGIPRNPDYNGAAQLGAAYCQYNIGRGKRVTSARAFLRPAVKARRIELRTHALVTRVLFDRTRATGVEYRLKGDAAARRVTARREVILCAGAIHSPLLLQRSGVGDPAHLHSIGIETVHPLPGVGGNLRDHYLVNTVVRVKDALTINRIVAGPRVIGEGLRWLLGKPSILGMGILLGQVFWKSDPALASPDLVVTLTPGSFAADFGGGIDTKPGMTFGVWQLSPQSHGHVRALTADPDSAPEIQPNYFSAETDWQVVAAGQRLLRRMLGEPSLARHVVAELTPGPSVSSDEQFIAHARAHGMAGFHYAGTCSMGPVSDPLAVVDERLRVRGVARLRVVDTSIMPRLTSGNTNAPAMMIAEKAADMIAEDARRMT